MRIITSPKQMMIVNFYWVFTMYQAKLNKYTSYLAPVLPCEGGVIVYLFDYVIIYFSDQTSGLQYSLY